MGDFRWTEYTLGKHQLEQLRQRHAAGVKITTLAREAGIPWQRLWGMLKPTGQQQFQPPRQHGTQQGGTRRHVRSRFNHAPGQQTPRNPVIREVRDDCEQWLCGRVRTIGTTAFTDRPVSMEYRGLFDVHSRSEGKVNYLGPAGRWSLKEGFQWWKTQHADK